LTPRRNQSDVSQLGERKIWKAVKEMDSPLPTNPFPPISECCTKDISRSPIATLLDSHEKQRSGTGEDREKEKDGLKEETGMRRAAVLMRSEVERVKEG
jgi:hypothetical protein